jgi:hypothetical protein
MRNNAPFVTRLAGGLVAACAFVFCAASPSIAAQKTTVVMYRAWTPAGKLANVRVTETVSGDCWTQSLVTSRADAYRCMAGNDIYDPCFAPKISRPRAVACAPNPFSNRVALFRLKKALPSSPDSTTQLLQPHNQPWGLRLTNGDTCVFATGATDAIKGERMNYACARSDGWIVGLPSQLTALWTAQSSDYPSKGVNTVLIAEAIF